MTDHRELLERAARACGLKVESWCEKTKKLWVFDPNDTADDNDEIPIRPWNPIASDGDAAWMEAKLMLDVDWDGFVVGAISTGPVVGEAYEATFDHPDRHAARRMASTRCAAMMEAKP